MHFYRHVLYVFILEARDGYSAGQKNFYLLYGTLSFIVVFTKACYQYRPTAHAYNS
jgi:hypothetical protein